MSRLCHRPMILSPDCCAPYTAHGIQASYLLTIISAHSPYIQFGFIKGTGAQDCGAPLAFTALQTLECGRECPITTSLECGNEG